MMQAGTASPSTDGWRLVAVDNGLGDPDAAPAAAGVIVADDSLPGAPPPAASDSVAGDVVLIGGILAGIALGIIVRGSVLKSQVAQLKDYDKARTTALIAGIATFLVVAGLAVGVSRSLVQG